MAIPSLSNDDKPDSLSDGQGNSNMLNSPLTSASPAQMVDKDKLQEEPDPNVVLADSNNGLQDQKVQEESKPVDLSGVNASLRGESTQESENTIAQKTTEMELPPLPSTSTDNINSSIVDNTDTKINSEVSHDKLEPLNSLAQDGLEQQHKTVPEGLVPDESVVPEGVASQPVQENDFGNSAKKTELGGNMLLIILLVLAIIALISAGVLVYIYLL